MMLVIGLTGSMGMGKSAVAAMIRDAGVAVFDADAEVHQLYENDALPLIEVAFPGTAAAGTVDRAKLGAELAKDPAGFKRLEAIVHPLVQASERRFLQEQQKSGAWAAVLEVPLLYETGGDAKVDVVIVVSAPPEIQRARVLARPGMTEARFEQLNARQLADAEKRRRAHFVVDTGVSLNETRASLAIILDTLKAEVRSGRAGTALRQHWSALGGAKTE